MVPFGNANYTIINKTKEQFDVEFKCQHGPQECLGNKIQVREYSVIFFNLLTLILLDFFLSLMLSLALPLHYLKISLWI